MSETVAETVASAAPSAKLGAGAWHTTDGGVLSIDSASDPVAQLFFGSQLGWLWNTTPLPSIEARVSGGSLGAPELGTGSIACQSMATSAEYQPFESGGRDGTPVTSGGVESGTVARLGLGGRGGPAIVPPPLVGKRSARSAAMICSP